MSRLRDVGVRLLTRHEKAEDGCWCWTGYTDGRYGLISIKGKEEKAHRASYSHFKGPIPEGMVVRHRCDNTKCINPDHLVLGTQFDNMRDMVERGRCRPGTQKYEDRTKFIGMPIDEIVEHGYSRSHASRLSRGIYT